MAETRDGRRETGVAHLTGLARHLFDSTVRLNRAHAKLKAAVSEALESNDAATVMSAIDAAADTPERRDALVQVERVLRQGMPEAPLSDVERKARDIVAGRRPVR